MGYGIVRNKVMAFMAGLNPKAAGTNSGRFTNMFVTVIAACWLSAPGNELRGYCLQPPQKFLRSTSVGSIIMGISLGVGTLATPQVEKLFAMVKEYLAKNPVGYVLIVLFALHQVLENRRQQNLALAFEDHRAKV